MYYMKDLKITSLNKGKISLNESVDYLIEKRVTKFGNGGKIYCPKKFIGRRVYVLVLK